MIFPFVCFIVGAFLLLYTVFFVRRPIPVDLAHSYQPRDKLIWAIAFGLFSLALMLGIVGYLHLLSAPTLHISRIVMLILGFIVFAYQLIDTIARP
jgi:hypothetical protein